MSRKVLLIIAAVAAVAFATSGGLYFGHSAAEPEPAAALEQPAKGKVDPQSTAAKALVRPLDTFGLELLQRQAAASPDGNVLVSPVSLHAVLSMVLNGARGETAEQMREALGLGSQPLDMTDQGWADLIRLSQSGKEPELSLADSLWLRQGFPFRRPFLDTNRDYFAAEMRDLAADPDEAAAAINDWVERRTAGRITELVRPDMFDASTILGLFNTVYLKVRWKHFDEADTMQEQFTFADGRHTDVGMMHAYELETDIAQTQRYDAVALSTDGPVTVWIIVPKGQDTAETLLAGLDARGLEDLYRRAHAATGRLALPKFTTRYEAKQLKHDLAAMGMTDAFSPGRADFSGVADVAPERIYVSEVVQKTFIELNEQGVEAAAASGATMRITSAPAESFDVRADHPFLIVLSEKATHAPLFMGLIRDPRND